MALPKTYVVVGSSYVTNKELTNHEENLGAIWAWNKKAATVVFAPINIMGSLKPALDAR